MFNFTLVVLISGLFFALVHFQIESLENLLLFFVALHLAHLSGYTSVMTIRGNVRTYGVPYDPTNSLLREATNILGTTAFLFLYIWGFINLNWWMPLILMALFGMLAGGIVGRVKDGIISGAYPFHYTMQRLYDIAAIAICIYLWVY